MEPLNKAVRDLGKKVAQLSLTAKLSAVGALLALGGAIALAVVLSNGGTYQYAFTNLTQDDAGEASAQLKAAGIPHRIEAGGTALAVPANQVYDARLLLAAAGLPRGGGIGFEIFDKGDLGVSEFTQKVNLRRATEGELARTVGRLSAIRSARVHITMAEKGLYRDEDRKATAAVVVNLQPGRALADRELQGIRHLVASAVPGLDPEAVTIVDGRGGVLAGESSAGVKAQTEQRDLERGLEGRVTELLEKAVGAGAVMTKVTAAMDTADVESTQDAYDPEATAVRSERNTKEQTGGEAAGPGGLAGAAANTPMAPNAGAGTGGTGRGGALREDEVKNYEISKTLTHTVTRGPRLRRLSVAVLVDGRDGKPRPAAEIERLGELVKSAVGFDAARGDRLEISSMPFTSSEEKIAELKPPIWTLPMVRYGALAGLGVLLLGAFGIAVLFGRRRRAAAVAADRDTLLLQPGTRVAELEAALNEQRAALPAGADAPALAAAGTDAAVQAHVDPNLAVRERARKLASEDPERAALLLKAWIEADLEEGVASAAGA